MLRRVEKQIAGLAKGVESRPLVAALLECGTKVKPGPAQLGIMLHRYPVVLYRARPIADPLKCLSHIIVCISKIWIKFK